MTSRKRITKITNKMLDKVNDRNIINHQGVPIELPSNGTLQVIADKHFNAGKRKRSTNYKDALQGDIDGILKNINKVD